MLVFAMCVPVVADASESGYKKGDRMKQWRQNIDNNKNTQQRTKQTTTRSNSNQRSNNSYRTPSFSTPTRNTNTTTTTKSSNDNTSRKIFLNNQIKDLEKKIKKEEKTYEKMVSSGSDDDWRKNEAIKTKRENIEELARLKSQYEAELSQLK